MRVGHEMGQMFLSRHGLKPYLTARTALPFSRRDNCQSASPLHCCVNVFEDLSQKQLLSHKRVHVDNRYPVVGALCTDVGVETFFIILF